ncbi:MAG: T9SS type A sorting domain-containing protein [Saprospiraceae bacterium]
MKHLAALLLLSLGCAGLLAQNGNISVLLQDKQQIIDGFGAHQGDGDRNQAWWKQLYFNDLGCSIYRVDLTPQLAAPYSNLRYHSPWFMGMGVTSVFNLEDPANPNGPENNRVRTYTGPQDYGRLFGGLNAPIAVMGPNTEQNIAYFTYSADGAVSEGLAQQQAQGDFKLVGSFWSPVPWVKVSSGDAWDQNWWPGPVAGTAWPFIWGGNFAGGRLDVSGTPLAVFNDGTGPTSSLTQYARSCAAYVKGYQRFHNVRFYAISIQNELNFEQFYNSATYPLSSQYITAIKAIRAAFDQDNELKDIRLMGPEDLLGGDAYGMWEYGGPIHKNLQYLANLALDPQANNAVDFFCIHGYDSDGASASGANSTLWNWWANGWQASPAPGIPANVKGFRAYNKKSWMTETSGEKPAWLTPAAGFPANGAWSLALRIHQALTTGRQSAWIYWTFSEADQNTGQLTDFALTTQALGANSPKYVAAKHFFKHIRPGAYRVSATVANSADLQASAYLHPATGAVTVVLLNTSATARTANLSIPGLVAQNPVFESRTSQSGSYWAAGTANFQNGSASVAVPAYGVVTLHANGAVTSVQQPESSPIAFFECQPNPFSQQTTLRYALTRPEQVHISLCDLNGRVLQTLLNEPRAAGPQAEILIEPNLSPGVYLLVLDTGNSRVSKKLVVLR